MILKRGEVQERRTAVAVVATFLMIPEALRVHALDLAVSRGSATSWFNIVRRACALDSESRPRGSCLAGLLSSSVSREEKIILEH